MKISIIITAYNVSDYIEQAIRSCISLSYKDLEIIIVNDCSTDDTNNIILKLAIEDLRIKIIQHTENLGAGVARKNGINASTGEYFITVDGDDWIDKDFINNLVTKAKETNADIVSCGITIERGDGYWEKICYGDTVVEDENKILKFWGEKVVFMNNKLIHKTLHEKVPYCSRRFIEDTPTIIPMLWYANKVVYVSDVGYHYRIHNNSITHLASAFKYALYRGLCALDLIEFFNKNDKNIMKKLPLKLMLQQQLNIIQQIKPSIDTINEYMTDWLNFSKRILI